MNGEHHRKEEGRKKEGGEQESVERPLYGKVSERKDDRSLSFSGDVLE